MSALISFATLPVVAAMLVAGTPSRPIAPTSAVESAYTRAVGRAIERAQIELQRSTDLTLQHVAWDQAWEARTDHYRVRTTHSRYLSQQIADGLEVMLGHFQTILGTDYTPPQPFAIYVFSNLDEYNGFGGSYAEHSSFYGSFYAGADPARPVATYFTENRVLLNMWATHSAAHQFVAAAFGRTPPLWVSEGLASCFALYWDSQWGISELERMKSGGNRFIPVDRLFGASLPEYAANPDDRMIEMGMLFMYLLLYREDTRSVVGEGAALGPFAEYLRTILTGGDAAALPIHGLMTSPSELEADFRDFAFR